MITKLVTGSHILQKLLILTIENNKVDAIPSSLQASTEADVEISRDECTRYCKGFKPPHLENIFEIFLF